MMPCGPVAPRVAATLAAMVLPRRIKHCRVCGTAVAYRVPADDNRERAVCPACSEIHYENPINVVGTVPVWGEQVLLCRRGGPVGNAFGKTGGTWFEWPRGRHSEKPQEFYALVERVSPGPHHEMFARRRREGWTCMGNEVTGVLVTPNAELRGRPLADGPA